MINTELKVPDANTPLLSPFFVTVTEEEFLTFFEQFGSLEDAVVMFDRETHRSRGFGFVTFQDAVSATNIYLTSQWLSLLERTVVWFTNESSLSLAASLFRMSPMIYSARMKSARM